jgi:hypothetical protein
MTDDEWLEECARSAAQSDTDRGGMPHGAMARAVKLREEAIREFGNERFMAAYHRWVQRMNQEYAQSHRDWLRDITKPQA